MFSVRDVLKKSVPALNGYKYFFSDPDFFNETLKIVTKNKELKELMKNYESSK